MIGNKWKRTVAIIQVLSLLMNSNIEPTMGLLTERIFSANTLSVGVSGNNIVSNVKSYGTTGENVVEDGTSQTEEMSTSEETTSEQAGENQTTGETEENTDSNQTGESTSTSQEEESTLQSTEDIPVANQIDSTTVQTQSEYDVMLLDEGDTSATTDLPSTVEEYLVAVQTQNVFSIDEAQDFINAQTLCADPSVNGFEGITLMVISAPSNGIWDITAIEGFTGIGTKENPFKGTLKCGFENGNGVEFRTNKPIVAYLGNGGTITRMNIVCEVASDGSVASAAVAGNMSGNVTIDDVWIRGTIGDGTGTVGTLAESVESGSVLNVNAVKVPAGETMTVSGAVAGGIAGTAGSNVKVLFGDDVALGTADLPIALSGSEAVGGQFGIATGNQNWDLSHCYTYTMDEAGNITDAVPNELCVTITGTANACYMGQFAGKLERDESDGTLTVTGGNMIAVDFTTSTANPNLGSAGGFVGLLGEGMKIVKPEGTFTIKGSIVADYGHCGGVAAVMVNPSMELCDYTIDAAIKNRNTSGGLIGEMQGGKCIVKNLMVTSTSVIWDTYTASPYIYCSGGVIGKVSNAGAVELQGTISVQIEPLNGGIFIGTIDRALVYLSEPEGIMTGEPDENGEVQKTCQLIKLDSMTLNEINTYGGIYRNQDMGNGTLLIGTGRLEDVGVINNTISTVEATNTEGVAEDWYQLTSAADFECLAIALGTEGCYGKYVFGLSDDEDYAVLLNSNYEVTKSVDISYDKTGIVTLNRNDKSSDINYAFSGKMKGVDDSISITQSMSIKQNYVGVFSSIKGNPEFSNLILDGTITNANGAGGLAYQFIDSRNTTSSSLTLSNITTRKVMENCSNYMSGILASENCSYSEITVVADNISLESRITAGNSGNYSGFIYSLSNAQVSISNVTLGGRLESTTTGSAGGFLGYSWTTINGRIENVKVNEGTEYAVSGYFGVLIKQITTQNKEGARLILDTVSLDGLTVDINYQRNNCGLLFQDVTSAVVEVIDYDSSGCVVNNPGTTVSYYFDEVAGQTKINSMNNAASFAYQTGIVSLHNSEKNFPEFHYENAATYCDKDGNEITGPTNNQFTMYFYDLFQYFEDEDGNIIEGHKIVKNDDGYYVLDTPEKLLLWDALQLVSSGARATFAAYYVYTGTFNTTTMVSTNQYVLKGELDLSSTSFYPVANITTSGTFIGEDDATIIFAADKLGIDNKTVGSRHYGMHAGLFYNTCQQNLSLSVSNLTLSGTIANVGADSGALIVGGNQITGTYASKGLSNGGTFKNITLDNLWVAHYDGTVSTQGATALLISKISQGSATFDNIKMVNYPKNSDTKAAAALISVAGSSDVTDLTLLFEHMTIADDIDGGSKHNGDVLSHASFIYHYDYTDDATINTGSGIYFFSTDDCDAGNVTFGNELDEYTEFSDTSDIVLTKLALSNTDYKPYVYEEADKDIAVNPKTGDILKGCGTYEDPYIIENERQFLTLYRYMNETGTKGSYQYQNFYESGDGWKIVIPGDDSTFCSQKHEVTWDSSNQSFVNKNTISDTTEETDSTESAGDDENTDSAEDAVGDENTEESTVSEEDTTVEEEEIIAVSIKYNPDDFPTPEELSKAYYRLEGDIDLTSLKDATYKTIADEFAGFGTESRPFVGVWLGKGLDGEIHTITLPDYAMTYETFGFIRYAKGAVVKDIHIKTAHKDLDLVDTGLTTGISEAGGAVIGAILGGDNIIDNVTVDVDYVVATNNTAVGGYVGIVKKGGLILRNIDDSALTGFRLGSNQGKVLSKDDSAYLFLGVIAGEVEDGYVIYDGEAVTDSGDRTPLYIWSGNGGNTNYSVVPDYAILDGRVLKEEADDITITLTEDAESTNIIDVNITIPNDAALQVMSMALNADALNIYHSTDRYYTLNGYRNTSRCRKADYSDVGCDTPTDDYLAAAKYDNLMGYSYVDELGNSMDANNAYLYPYLYDYMGITKDAYMDYAAAYNSGEYYYSILNPSIFSYGYMKDEKKISVKYRANWILAENSTYDMAQFGDGFRGIGALYQVGDIYGGSFRGNFDGNKSTIILDMNRRVYSTYNTSYYYCRAGLFNTIYGAGQLPYNQTADFVDTVSVSSTSTQASCFTIKNIKLAGQINVTGVNQYTTANVGGIVGTIQNANYIFDNITLDETNPLTIGNIGDDSTNYSMNYIRNCGGLIGLIQNGGNYLIQNCTICGTESKNVSFKASYDACGGFVGSCSSGKLKIVNSNVNYLTAESAGYFPGNSIGIYAGGMIGYNSGTVIFAGTTDSPILVEHSTIKGKQVGGFIGAVSGGNGIYMDGIQCKDSSIGYTDTTYYAGGLIGNSTGKFVISNVLCDNLHIGSYECLGGAIGRTYRVTSPTITDATISNITMEEIESGTSYCYMGGVIGYGSCSVTLENISVTGTKTDDEYSFQMISQEKKRRIDMGGLIGCHVEYQVTMRNCSVDTIMISGDALNTTSTANSVHAGGAVGYMNYSATNILENLTTKNLYINVNPQDKAISSEHTNTKRAAGGCFGYISNNAAIRSNDSADPYCYGISATNNTITGRLAGGMIGYTTNNNIKLCGIEVSDGTITSDGYAGGMIGHMETNFNSNSTVFVIKGTTATGQEEGSDSDSEDDSDTYDIVNKVSNMEITAPSAGGFVGYYYGQYGQAVIMEDIVIENSSIVSKKLEKSYWNSGGVIGTLEGGGAHTLRCNDVYLDNNLIVCEVEDDTLSDAECNYIAAGGVIGKLENKTTKALGQFLVDNIVLKDNNVIGVRKAGNTEMSDVKLVRKATTDDTTCLVLSDIELPETGDDIVYDYEVIDSLEQDYGYFVGSFIGTYTSHADSSDSNIDIYILSSDDEENIFDTPVMRVNPPVVDVGRNYKDYDLVNEDTYREFCHIVYGAANEKAEDAVANLADMKKRVTAIESAYTGSETVYELLAELRVSEAAIETFDTAYEEGYTVVKTETDTETGNETETRETMNFPVLVYRVQDGTLQDVMDDITDVMTNVAGVPSTDMGVISVNSTPMLSVTCKPMIYDSSTGTSTSDTEGTASLAVKTTDAGAAVFTSAGYDSVVDGKMSYTLVTYTYGWYDTDDLEYHQKVFCLPIFMEEPILYSVHSMIMEGKVASVETLKEKGVPEVSSAEADDPTKIIMANDSDYTMLLEYTYGQARGWMTEDVIMDKVLYLAGSGGVSKSYPVGTRLLLIDVTHGNKGYYYTVEQEVDKIYFSQFTDSQGVNYTNQPINNLPDETDEGAEYYTDMIGHQLTNVGVERYLLTVLKEPSSTDTEEVFTIHNGLYTTDADLEACFQLEEKHLKESVWSVRSIPGLTVSLTGKGTDTDISGRLSKTDSLNVKASFSLIATELYWMERANANGNIIDSSNNGKYIEIAFYLKDGNGNRVSLPEGANFSYQLTADSYSNNKALADSSLIYYYKDIRNTFGISNFEYLINNISGNTTVSTAFNLDFGGADMSNITEDSYTAVIELLKTANKDYPMGSNNKVDDYSETVNADPVNPFGFAIHADDITDLGINTYPEAAEEDLIPCHVMFDFDELLNATNSSSEKTSVLEKWSNYEYEVTYQLYKKVKSTGDSGEAVTYEKYQDDDIKLSATVGDTTKTSLNGNMQVTYVFTQDDIADGNGEDPQDGLLTFPVQITQNTKTLTENLDNLTNYKLEATLVIREKGTTGQVSETTVDFLIYTVTKLNFDM